MTADCLSTGSSSALTSRLAVWRKRTELDPNALPPTWSAIPAGATSAGIGSDWLKSLRSAILMVPSVIVPEEQAALINPAHPDAVKVKAKVVRPFEYNKVFRPQLTPQIERHSHACAHA